MSHFQNRGKRPRMSMPPNEGMNGPVRNIMGQHPRRPHHNHNHLYPGVAGPPMLINGGMRSQFGGRYPSPYFRNDNPWHSSDNDWQHNNINNNNNGDGMIGLSSPNPFVEAWNMSFHQNQNYHYQNRFPNPMMRYANDTIDNRHQPTKRVYVDEEISDCNTRHAEFQTSAQYGGMKSESTLEYEPENPDIVTSRHPAPVHSPVDLSGDLFPVSMPFCDDQGFHDAFIGVVISRYPSVLGRLHEVAGYGVWFSDGHYTNSSGVLKPGRPQNIKAVTIHGSAKAVETMKREGYTKIRINLETDYLNTNVCGWISKYMENPKASPTSWDEVKYLLEILELCESASGMIIKWSRSSEVLVKKRGIAKAEHCQKSN